MSLYYLHERERERDTMKSMPWNILSAWVLIVYFELDSFSHCVRNFFEVVSGRVLSIKERDSMNKI